jgi:hypothetical protein
MGAASDIKKGLSKNLANFTKQRKAEEKHSSAGRWRMSRMTEVHGPYLTEAAQRGHGRMLCEGFGQWPAARDGAANLLRRPTAD